MPIYRGNIFAVALGGDASGEQAPGRVDMEALRTANKVLEALYDL